MPKAKPYSGPVKEDILVSLLNSTGETVEGDFLGTALVEAAARLNDLVDQANDALEKSEFTAIVANHLAAQMNRRGFAQIWVSDTGSAVLDISYDDEPKKRRRKANQRIPLMDELKARAEAMGVDITHLGIKRKKIRDYLDAIEAGEIDPKSESKSKPKSKPSKKKAKKEAAPKKPVPEVKTAEDEPEEDPGPMSAGPDETRTSSPLPDEPKPPKRGFMKTSQAISGPVVVDTSKGGGSANGAGSKPRSLSQLQQDAEELDVASLIASDPPK